MSATTLRPSRENARTDLLRDVTAAILAGGLGTRLRSALPDTPKVLAPVLGRPFLAYGLDRLAAAGLRRVVLLTGYRADLVRATIGTRHGPLSVRYSEETCPLGTGGALKAAAAELTTPRVLLLNGDSFCDVDLAELAAAHRDRAADLTLTLAPVDDASRFGRVTLTDTGRVTAFLEKQPGGGPGLINAGVYLLNRDLLDDIPAGRPVSLERELLPGWMAARRLYGHACAGPFLDIGTPESYAAAGAIFGTAAGAAPAKL